ncbi:hypothetical protein MACH05_23660 [Qipengyuania nanhaisediminis]
MSRSNRRKGEILGYSKLSALEGTGDGLFCDSLPQEIIYRRKTGINYPEVENRVSPVPRPFFAPGAFREHLAAGEFAHRFARDFAKDALGDPDMPEISSWSELHSYLGLCGACREAVVGAALTWRSFRASNAQGRGA